MGQRMMENPEMMGMMMKDPTKIKGMMDHMVNMVANDSIMFNHMMQMTKEKPEMWNKTKEMKNTTPKIN
ncbi:hypothetical protein [Algoriphagus antarcticus]|nr:hypothetical protein [Algoriphagus antarcticus]